MSWLTCDHCGCLIDTDENPGAYDEQRDLWLCPDCKPPEAVADLEEWPDGYQHYGDAVPRTLATRRKHKRKH